MLKPLLTVAGLFGLFIACSAASETFSRPRYYLDYTDSVGTFQVWLDLDEIALSDGSRIPFRMQFSAGGSHGDAPFGAFWICPVVQATALPWDERYIEFATLGGKNVYLRHDPNAPGELRSSNGLFHAKQSSKDRLTVTGDGWQYEFQNGRLKTAKKHSGVTLEWTYNNGRFESIAERGKGEVLSFSYSANAPLPVAININRKSYAVTSQKVPIIKEVMGRSLVAGYLPTISEISHGDTVHRYSIALIDPETYLLEYRPSNRPSGDFTWSAKNGQLILANGCRYKVEVKEGNTNAVVSRTNERGEVESYFYDRLMGIGEYRGFEGGVTVRQYFTGRGPTQHKIRSMKESFRGKEILSTRWAYDEMGRLIRKISGDVEWNWERYPDGTVAKMIKTKAGREIEREVFDETGALAEKMRGDTEYRYLKEGDKTVIQQLRNGVMAGVVVRSAGQRGVFFSIEKDTIVEGSPQLEEKKTSAIEPVKELVRRILLRSEGK